MDLRFASKWGERKTYTKKICHQGEALAYEKFIASELSDKPWLGRRRIPEGYLILLNSGMHCLEEHSQIQIE